MSALEPDETGLSGSRLLFVPEHAAAGPSETATAAWAERHPASRLLAVTVLVLAAAVHNALIQWLPSTERLLGYGVGMALYGAASWALLGRWRRASPPRGGGALFLILDILPLAATVWVTGASRSWLFWVVLLHAVDEVPRGARRAAAAAGLGVAAYLAVLGVAAGIDGQTLSREPELGKLALLLLASLWIVLAARRSGHARSTVLAELGEARERAADLVEDYGHLERAAGERSRERSEFLLRVALEIRGPVRGILRAAQADRTEVGREMVETGRHLLDIVNEVIDPARVESGSLARELGPVAVRPALDDVLEQAVGAARRRGIQMPSHAPIPDDVWVEANDRKLRQVFANLISNAIKYNRPDGRIDVDCQLEDDRLRIRVRDTGPGIPPERIDAAFAPFDRLGAERTGVGGTGLGLTLARSLVEAMHGELGVESEPGTGSTFWFRLRRTEPPAAVGEPIPEATEATEATIGHEPGAPSRADPVRPAGLPGGLPAEEAGWEPRAWAAEPRGGAGAGWAGESGGGRPLVLYVDASPDNVAQVGRVLNARPEVELLWTPLGLQALEAAAARRPELVLLHMDLLDLRAEEVFHRLRRDPALREVPVAVVTRRDASRPEAERLVAAGALGPLTAPYDEAELWALVESALPGGPTGG